MKFKFKIQQYHTEMVVYLNEKKFENVANIRIRGHAASIGTVAVGQ